MKVLIILLSCIYMTFEVVAQNKSNNLVQIGQFDDDKSKPLIRDLIQKFKGLESSHLTAKDEYDIAKNEFKVCQEKFESGEFDKARSTMCSIKATQKLNRAIGQYSDSFTAFNRNLDSIIGRLQNNNQKLLISSEEYQKKISSSKQNINALLKTSEKFLDELKNFQEGKAPVAIENKYLELTDDLSQYNQELQLRKRALFQIQKNHQNGLKLISSLEQKKLESSRKIKQAQFRISQNHEYIEMMKLSGNQEMNDIQSAAIWKVFNTVPLKIDLGQPMNYPDYESPENDFEDFQVPSSNLTVEDMIKGLSKYKELEVEE